MSDIMWLHCVSPMHNGSGEGLGALDRPIIRERATGFPYVQSSTLKGSLRALAERLFSGNRPLVDAGFGKGASGEDGGNQGCVCLDDAQMALFPVRSMRGTFAWVTSTMALARLRRTFRHAGMESHALHGALDALINADVNLAEDEFLAVPDTPLVISQGKACLENRIIRERMDGTQRELLAKAIRGLGAILYPGDEPAQDFLAKRAVVLSDELYTELARNATVVEANIRIGKDGVTEDGSLRYTEFLPAETVLYSLCTLLPPLSGGVSGGEIETLLKGTVYSVYTTGAANPSHGLIQFGADETKGKGLAVTRLTRLAAAANAGQGDAKNG